MTVKKRRMWRIVLSVLVLLVAFRLTLPFIVTRYVNNVLNDLEGYQGSIAGVDIDLYRGAYEIDSIKIFKVEGDTQIPVVEIPLTDLSIEWNALFDGALVSEVTLQKPVLNFIAHEETNHALEDSTVQTEMHAGEDVDWTEALKKLVPFPINRLRVNDGKIAYYDFTTTPEVDLFLNNVQLDALNLTNTKDNPEPLPSRIYLQALSVGNGQLNIAMKANVQKDVPDLDMEMRFESVGLRALNDFFAAYANLDVEQGRFDMYSEVAVTDGSLSGYIKPLFHELRVANLTQKADQPEELVWRSMADFVTEALAHQKKGEFTTKVALSGEILSSESSFLPSLWNIFSNAFVEAFDQKSGQTISVASASTASSAQEKTPEEAVVKSKKDIRKERRKERREERKKRKERKNDSETADEKDPADNSRL